MLWSHCFSCQSRDSWQMELRSHWFLFFFSWSAWFPRSLSSVLVCYILILLLTGLCLFISLILCLFVLLVLFIYTFLSYNFISYWSVSSPIIGGSQFRLAVFEIVVRQSHNTKFQFQLLHFNLTCYNLSLKCTLLWLWVEYSPVRNQRGDCMMWHMQYERLMTFA